MSKYIKCVTTTQYVTDPPLPYRTMRHIHPPPKNCTTCGRMITWRKKWERNWSDIRYCSQKCKINKNSINNGYEQALLTLLQERKEISPTDILTAEQLNDAYTVELTRQAARRVGHHGKIVILTMKNQVVDPSKFRGPIKLRLA